MRGAFGGSWDWSCQRLTRRALERYKEKIRTWKQKTLARVEKKVKNEGLTIVFIDESGLNLRTAAVLGRHGERHQCCNITSTGRCCRRSRDLVELLLPVVSRSHSQPADHRVSRPSWDGVPDIAAAASTLVAGVSPGLSAGTKTGQVSVVTLETARVAQLPPTRLGS